ncbi:casein kinase II regulatory subunit-domain-containing protein, partial [Peziza echinospora]
MPPPPRQRAPHLLPVQNHQRQNPQHPISNPSSATSAGNPYHTFISQQSRGASSAGNSPLHEYLPQSPLVQSHYGIVLDPLESSPVDGPDQSPYPRARLEAEARQQHEYRLQNEDGDSVIDFYGQNADERVGGFGGGSSASQSPIDYTHGTQAHHNLLWQHHQQRLQQHIAAANQRGLERQPSSPGDYSHHDFAYQQPQENPRDFRSRPSSQKSTPPSSTTNTVRSRDLRESFPSGLERELSLLSVGDRGTGSPRAQGFGFNSEVVERVIEQPYYPPIPKLTSSPTNFAFPSPTIASKIHSHAPNPATSPPSLPPPPSSSSTQHLLHDPPSVPSQPSAYQYRQPPAFSSSFQAEEDPEEQHSNSSTESEASSSAEEEDEDEEMSTSSTPASWISSFCSLQGHEYFAEVSEDFIEDDFNLTGLSSLVPMYKESLEMILDVEPDEEDEEPSEEEADEDDSQPGGPVQRQRRSERAVPDIETLESQAELLYGLIHQRFITSRQGMQMMFDKYQNNHFGFCPRVFCNSTRVLPCGYSDTPGIETVKLYCPSCMDMYVPPNSRFQTVDGAFFGTTFPTLFFLTFPDFEVGNHIPVPLSVQGPSGSGPVGGYKPAPSQLKKMKAEAGQGEQRIVNGVLEGNIAPGLGKGKMYEMKIYGFKVSERAKGGPRMKWLRSKPDDILVLDETARMNGME